MRTSIKITSGRVLRTSVHRGAAVLGLAGQFQVGLGLDQDPQPHPDQGLIIGHGDPNGHARPLGSAVSGKLGRDGDAGRTGRHRQPPADRPRPLAHAHDAAAFDQC